jgi:hypothetical protein
MSFDRCDSCGQPWVGHGTACVYLPQKLNAYTDENTIHAFDARIKELEAALRETTEMIAACRLILGHHLGVRHVGEIEERAAAALSVKRDAGKGEK